MLYVSNGVAVCWSLSLMIRKLSSLSFRIQSGTSHRRLFVNMLPLLQQNKLMNTGWDSPEYSGWMTRARNLVPSLLSQRHKGQAGRVGIVGGSLEYTGAPYYAAISALRVGVDLVHVFCAAAAGPAIKAYSPELIVHPVLDAPNALESFEQWLPRLHVLVIGPGLGRNDSILNTVVELLRICRTLSVPVIIDADGLFLLIKHPEVIYDFNGAILTPNEAEFQRLFGSAPQEIAERMRALGAGVTIMRKGVTDRIYESNSGLIIAESPKGGSGRRCGGQGDLLAGAVAAFYCWASSTKNAIAEPSLVCWAASVLTKECNVAAFAANGRGMLTTDMISSIPRVFREIFDSDEKLNNT